MGGNVELDVSGGAILTGATPPLFGSLSLRWQFVEPIRPVGVGVAVEGKAALQGVPGKGLLTTDTFANFSGISLGIPIQVTFGQVSLLAEYRRVIGQQLERRILQGTSRVDRHQHTAIFEQEPLYQLLTENRPQKEICARANQLNLFDL